MDEIADLIRLLAEAPAEEAPMSRPREFLDRLAIEKVAKEGIHPEGPAVPDAVANPSPQASGVPSTFKLSEPITGAVADPRTGIPSMPMEVRAYVNQDAVGTPVPARISSGTLATVTPAERATEPFRDRVMAPETFVGLVATPVLLDAIAGMPADVRGRETVSAEASPTPTSQVTISIPPAFPIDPKEAFSRVDEQLELPPRQEDIPRREVRVNTEELILESTEARVARLFQNLEGNRTNQDRWGL